MVQQVRVFALHTATQIQFLASQMISLAASGVIPERRGRSDP